MRLLRGARRSDVRASAHGRAHGRPHGRAHGRAHGRRHRRTYARARRCCCWPCCCCCCCCCLPNGSHALAADRDRCSCDNAVARRCTRTRAAATPALHSRGAMPPCVATTLLAVAPPFAAAAAAAAARAVSEWPMASVDGRSERRRRPHRAAASAAAAAAAARADGARRGREAERSRREKMAETHKLSGLESWELTFTRTLRMPSVRTHRMRPFPSRVSKRREREGTASREGCRAGDGVLSENSQRIERRLLS